MVWMMDVGGREAEIEFPVVASPCGNSASLTVTTEEMLAAVEAELLRLAASLSYAQAAE